MLAKSRPSPDVPEKGHSAVSSHVGAGRSTGSTCTLWYLRRELGRETYGHKRMCTYVTKLIEKCDFPVPLPTLRRGDLTDSVTSESRWLRIAVDSWLDAQLPGPAAADQADSARADAIADMDSAAFNLRLIGGTDRDGAV